LHSRIICADKFAEQKPPENSVHEKEKKTTPRFRAQRKKKRIVKKTFLYYSIEKFSGIFKSGSIFMNNFSGGGGNSSSRLRKQNLFIALGFMLILDGIFFSLSNLRALNFSVSRFWPIVVINAGLSFFAADFFMYRRIRTVSLFPSLMMFFFGVIFLLFSTKIFPFSLKKIVSFCWPFVLVVFGIILVSVYGVQRMNRSEFPYMQDDSAEENFSENM
jgi:hypothetical protein